ncbi:esterase/lipase family protein [Skermania piniformis]|uniref:GPI inositol-deacylase n=1 Tax=Skermania pinensis TaxID=39122 RepID=A0ABX8S7A6_9ACTN|nr:hypothetical protein [Skermania piniformis]QXQ13702.1 GPI inositol-deacylase [Skermania piniformis]
MPESSSASETRALARLAAVELAGAATGVGAVHRAISDRVFAGVRRGVGPPATAVQTVHDLIAGGVYQAISQTLQAGAELADVAPGLDALPAPSGTDTGAGLLGILHGLRGDALTIDAPALTPPMTVRCDNVVVPLDRPGLRAAFPTAGPRIAVFLHGLMETEHAWRHGEGPSYAERLAADLGYSPVLLRYNTGRHISDNGAELDRLLTELVSHWPVPVTEIALIGHSMGGLVGRSACHSAVGADWVDLVRSTVSLGSPHFGAPLAQLVHVGSAALAWLPETRPFANLLRRRSAGIRDLRGGSLVEQDWRDRDADALAAVAAAEVPLLPSARHYFISASLTRNPRHPVGRIVGDGLVLVPSARGHNRRRQVGFTPDSGIHLGSTSHFGLLNCDAGYTALRDWLAPTEHPADVVRKI